MPRQMTIWQELLRRWVAVTLLASRTHSHISFSSSSRRSSTIASLEAGKQEPAPTSRGSKPAVLEEQSPMDRMDRNELQAINEGWWATTSRAPRRGEEVVRREGCLAAVAQAGG
eukprot:5370396-Prymnesium_polylepis.2